MTCCFFGHRDVEENIEPLLEKNIKNLIKIGVTTFYVENHGSFDKMVYRVLEKIIEENKTIKFNVILAYLPKKDIGLKNTLYPEGVEMVPLRFAISYRNKWMINSSEYVIAYVKREFGGAAQFCELAKRKGKIVINIAEMN